MCTLGGSDTLPADSVASSERGASDGDGEDERDAGSEEIGAV